MSQSINNISCYSVLHSVENNFGIKTGLQIMVFTENSNKSIKKEQFVFELLFHQLYDIILYIF